MCVSSESRLEILHATRLVGRSQEGSLVSEALVPELKTPTAPYCAFLDLLYEVAQYASAGRWPSLAPGRLIVQLPSACCRLIKWYSRVPEEFGSEELDARGLVPDSLYYEIDELAID